MRVSISAARKKRETGLASLTAGPPLPPCIDIVPSLGRSLRPEGRRRIFRLCGQLATPCPRRMNRHFERDGFAAGKKKPRHPF
jgi:hypothetical protein